MDRVAVGVQGEQCALEVVNRVYTSEGTQRPHGEQPLPALAGRLSRCASSEADGLHVTFLKLMRRF